MVSHGIILFPLFVAVHLGKLIRVPWKNGVPHSQSFARLFYSQSIIKPLQETFLPVATAGANATPLYQELNVLKFEIDDKPA